MKVTETLNEGLKRGYEIVDEELLESGGALFLFRKFGDAVTGTYK